MNITLEPMTLELAHLFYRNFAYDPNTFVGTMADTPYVYAPEQVNTYCEKQCRLHRIHLGILADQQPVGEILFKNLNQERRSCVLSIHLQNDTVKNRGIGTEATRMALEYAFTVMKMKTVFADALIQNKRSCHVLTKVGFKKIDRDNEFCYFRYDISAYQFD